MTILPALLLFALQDPAAPPKEKEETPLRVPLVEKAALGGQIRIRGEVRDPVDYRLPGTFGRPATEDVRDGDEYALLRVRLNLDLDVVKDLKAYVQLEDSRTFGEETTVLSDTQSTHLHQGWAQFSNILDQPLAIRAGRMDLPTLGDGRLVSPLDWHNVARTWDGATATFTPGKFWIYGFGTLLGENAGTNGRDQYFYGLYASYRGVEKHELDAYAFVRDFRDQRDQNNTTVTSETGVAGNIRDQTFGVRLKGAASGFDYSAEADLQTGRFSTDRTKASAAAALAGYTFDMSWKPRVGVEVTRATGDNNGADGDRKTFDPLFPYAHTYHGSYDLVAWKNIRTAMVSVRVQPCEKASVELDAHLFRLEQARDAWFGVAPALGKVRQDATGAAGKDLGSELDLHAKASLNERTDVWAGVCWFLPGTCVEKTGPDPTGLFGFAQVTVKF